MSETGTIKFFDSRKGYGFIVPDDGGPEVMFHYSEAHIALSTLAMNGRAVAYGIEKTETGERAKDVRLRRPVMPCPCCGGGE